MAAQHLLLACSIFALQGSADISRGLSPEVTGKAIPDAVDDPEVAIDKEHAAAIESLDQAIEQEVKPVVASPPVQPVVANPPPVVALSHVKPAVASPQPAAKTRAQQRVEALEAALAAADQQNKALEAALEAADQQNKLSEVIQEAKDAPVQLRLRGAMGKAPTNGSAEVDEKSSNSTDEVVEESESAMEKSLTDLMLGSRITGSPFGKSVKQIAKLINKGMIPKVLKAHKANQKHLDKLARDMTKCDSTKDALFANADKSKAVYLRMSPLHKSCRADEAGRISEKTDCFNDVKDKKRIKDLKCKAFSMIAKQHGDQQANRQIVKKGGSESTDSYITRLTSTICGQSIKKFPLGGLGGGGKGGFLDLYLKAKGECVDAAKAFNAHSKKCKTSDTDYESKRAECDSIQDQMDGASCMRATEVKDACESYAGCYMDKKKALTRMIKLVKKEEKDRKKEWRGLKRMQCLIKAFGDGEVYKGEVKRCRKKEHDTDHLKIDYPKVPEMATCSVPDLYPTTAAYKIAEFAPLPALAKGKKDAFECSGVMEISTTPQPGSPKTCKCERVTLNGPYSAGPLIKCTDCWDTRRSLDKNSCPAGTKIFSPQSARDWKTVLSSVGELKEPYFLVDVTRPQNGCGDCTDKAMNSGPEGQPKQWRTSDGSPWFLRERPFTEPNGNYHANCYLGMLKVKSSKKLEFDDSNCKFHAKSYYCQPEALTTTPKEGSPPACKCDPVVLTGPYSAGALIKCTACLSVSKSTQKNSCPVGTKLFSPASRSDWKTIVTSTTPLRSPHWIVDITRPQNGCGGCTKYSMNYGEPAQRTWRTSDGSPWWLRSTKYSEPNGDYTANCYMDLWHTPVNEDSVTFNDGKCNYYSSSYYCQPVKSRGKKK